MDEKLMQEFIQWLPQNIEEFANKFPEEIITAINELSKSEDGVKMLQQLMTAFQQSKLSNSFKLGGKIEAAVNKFQQGGLTRKQALKNYMMNNKGTTRSQSRQAYRNEKFVGKYNIGNDALKNDGYQNNRDWARQLISGQTTNSNEPKASVTPTNNLMTTVGLPKTMDIRRPVVSTNHNGIDLSHGSFNDAFAAARRQGLNTFRWNGGLYGTQLKDEVSILNPQNITVTPKNQDNSVNSLVEQVMDKFGGGNPMSISNQSKTEVNQNPDSEIILTPKGVVSIQPDYDLTTPANASGSKKLRGPVTWPMRGLPGRRSLALQDGGKFDPYYGPLKVTDEGYFDVDGREVVYEEPRIKQWINARNERKRLESNALSEAGFGKGVQLDTFNNKPWESITRGVHRGGIYTPADTILIKHLDNGKLQRENAKSLKTFISRKLFGDSKFDQINREFENN